jgi:hypothetical protein
MEAKRGDVREFEKVMFGGKAESDEVVDVCAEIKMMVEIASKGRRMFVMEGDEEIEVRCGKRRQRRVTELLNLSFDDGFSHNQFCMYTLCVSREIVQLPLRCGNNFVESQASKHLITLRPEYSQPLLT